MRVTLETGMKREIEMARDREREKRLREIERYREKRQTHREREREEDCVQDAAAAHEVLLLPLLQHVCSLALDTLESYHNGHANEQ